MYQLVKMADLDLCLVLTIHNLGVPNFDPYPLRAGLAKIREDDDKLWISMVIDWELGIPNS